MNYENILLKLVERIPVNHFSGKRWFRSKAAKIKSVSLSDSLKLLQKESSVYFLCFIKLELDNGKNETYATFLGVEPPGPMESLVTSGDMALIDCDKDTTCITAFLQLCESNTGIKTTRGRISFSQESGPVQSANLLAETSSNTLFLNGDREIIKLFRKITSEENPELQLLSWLNKAGVRDIVPEITGAVYYRSESADSILAIRQKYIENSTSAWTWCTRSITSLFEAMAPHISKKHPSLNEINQFVQHHCEKNFIETEKLGNIVAQIHESITPLEKQDYSRDELTGFVKNIFSRLASIQELKDESSSILPDLLNRLETLDRGSLIRIHGDLHLDQVLKTRDGFVIIDFEGEPLKSISDRLKPASPFKDIAGMVRSFNYAVYSSFFEIVRDTDLPSEEKDLLLSTGKSWEHFATQSFMKGYFSQDREHLDSVLPESSVSKSLFLAIYMMDKALYEYDYEINNRPDWVEIPLNGIRDCCTILKTTIAELP